MHQPRSFHNRRLPKIWLMTDKRNDAGLEESVRALPRGSGVIFRHYHLEPAARHQRFIDIQSIARRRGLILLLAGPPALARKWRADGVHGRQWNATAGMLHSAPVHSPSEIRQAKRAGADIFFLSPAYATRSHHGQKPLGRLQLNRMIRLCNGPVILLGGMTGKRFHTHHKTSAHGWAAIDALIK